MNSNDSDNALDSDSRRQLLRSLSAAVAGAVAAPLWSQTVSAEQGHQHGSAVASEGGKGDAVSYTEKPVIAMLVHPRMVAQDLIGPWTVFNLMRGSEIHLVWKDLKPVSTELGLPIPPTTTFADCPEKLDVLFVPGGLDGSIQMMGETEVLEFLADRGKNSRFITSDCTGSLVLGAAGLLKGYRATSHWYVRDHLAHLGATPVYDRVVHDRNRITGGGVTAGLDFGLTLAALLRGEEMAKHYQLVLEYMPSPPFNAGTPETAPQSAVDHILSGRGPTIEKARQAAVRIGKEKDLS